MELKRENSTLLKNNLTIFYHFQNDKSDNKMSFTSITSNMNDKNRCYDFSLREKYLSDKLFKLTSKVSAKAAEMRLELPKNSITSRNKDLIEIEDLSKAIDVIEQLVWNSQISGNLDKLLK